MRKSVLSVILAILIVVLAASCNMSGTSVSERQDLTISPELNGVSVASIVPITPTPVKLTFELWNNGEAKVTETLDYAGDGASYVIEDVLVGTYTVYAYGIDFEGRKIMMGSNTFTVKPLSSNDCRIEMDFLSQSTGSLKVMITWNPSELSDSPISEAIESGKLGFLGFFAEDDTALKGGSLDDGEAVNLIKWVDDTSTGKFEYIEEAVPSTGNEGADIYFIIYTKDDDGNVIALAKTFYTSITVYDNLESVPDANETYNFKLDSSSIEGYISNVSALSVTAEPDPESPKDTLIVTWENPVFSADVYPITVYVWLTDDSGRIIGSKQYFPFADKTAAENGGSAKFRGLSSDTKYDVWFSVKGAIGYSKEEVKLKDVNPKIGVQSIAFPYGFAATYVAGQSVDIKPVFTPAEATDQSFTVTENGSSENITIDGSKVTFDHAGNYTLVITSTDNPKATKGMPVTVRLGKPSSVSAVANDTGIIVSWTEVADADGYKITRTAEGGDTANFEVTGKTEYNDLAVFGGEKYTYSVQAIKNGDETGALTGDSVSSSQVSVPIGGIQVVLPTITTADFSAVLGEQLVGKYMVINDDEKDSIKIGFSGEVTDSNGNKAEKYIWKLEGTVLASGTFDEAGIFTLDYNNPEHQAAFHISSEDSVNNLMIEVQFAGSKPRTATAQFHVLTGNPGTVVGITDAGDDGRVVYNSASDRTEQLTLNLTGNKIDPLITWSIDPADKEIATIDENGNLTVLKSGTATVNAQVNALGEEGKTTAEIECYVPVTAIELKNLTNNRLIIAKDGVTVSDTKYSSVDFDIELTGPDGLVPTLKAEDLVPVYDSSFIDISGTGAKRTITTDSSKKAGNATVKVSADEAVSNELTIIVHDFDIYINDLNTKVTGHDAYEIAGGVFSDKRYSLYVRTSNTSETVNSLPFTTKWCMADKEGSSEPLNSNTTVSTNSPRIWLKIEGSDWDGTVIRASNTDIRNVGVIISDSVGAIAQVFFQTKSTI